MSQSNYEITDKHLGKITYIVDSWARYVIKKKGRELISPLTEYLLILDLLVDVLPTNLLSWLKSLGVECP